MSTEWNAAAYRRISALQEWLAGKSLARLALGGDERVLDIGCGDGRLSAAVAASVPRGRVLGIDASHAMIAFAARTFPPAAHPPLRFAVADAAALPCAAAFDHVVSFNALHWLPECDAPLAGIHAALVPGGRALLRFVPAAARPSLEDVIEATCHTARWAPWFTAHRTPFLHPDAADYAARAARAGFTVVRCEVVEETWDFGSRDAFARFADTTFVAWTRRLPKAEHPAFITDVLDRYAAVEPPAPPHAFVFSQLEIELVRSTS